MRLKSIECRQPIVILLIVTEAINKGAIYRFLTKPWDEEDLRHHIREAFRTWEGLQ